ncbi:MAG: 3'-5' exonuclease [Gallionella sp.]
MPEKPKHKLEVRLIPQPAWGRNVRAVISDENWQALRKYFGAFFEYDWIAPPSLVCETCGESKREGLHLHETWDFDNEKNIQKLTGFMAVCEDCHNAIHLGRANILGLGEKAKAHLTKVNGWSDEALKAHIINAGEEWLRKSCASPEVIEHHHETLSEKIKAGDVDFEDFDLGEYLYPPYVLNLDWLIERELLTEKQIHLNWLNRPKRVFNKDEVIDWAKKILKSPQATILDTETTGLVEGSMANPQAEVIELAIISMTGEVLYNQRFLPLFPIPERTTEIHGITNKMVAKCPSFKEEYPKILEILTGKIAIAYKTRFDEKVIKKTCQLHELPPLEDIMWECAMKMFTAYRTPETQHVKLPNASHSAVNDCRATLALITKMSKNEHIDYQRPESHWQREHRLSLEKQNEINKLKIKEVELKAKKKATKTKKSKVA